MAKEAWFINESELDDYQVQIIQRKLSDPLVVKGCAGSGKTVLALWRAKEIEEQGLGSYYVIVFTKALRQFISDGVRALDLQEGRVLYHWQWKNRGCPNADFIIVDEAQDFGKNELMELENAASQAFVCFGDSAQQLYSFLKPDLQTMDQIAVNAGIPISELVLNHRLPKKIAKVAELVSAYRDPLESRCVKAGLNKPFLVERDSLEEEYDFIIETIKERGYKDVGILFPDNYAVEQADIYFDEIDYKVEAKYDKGNRSKKIDLNFHTSNPKLLTYHSSKGLQFEAVFLPNCCSDDERSRNALYVALTRTYQDLYVSYHAHLSSFIENVPQEYFTIPKIGNIERQRPISSDSDDLPF